MSSDLIARKYTEIVRAHWIPISVVFGIALLHRLLYLYFLEDNPLYDSPALDAALHVAWGREIAFDSFVGQSAPFFRAPFYAYFLGAIFKIAGFSYHLPRLIQFSLGALSCVLIYLLAYKITGKLRTASIAGLLAASYWPFIYFEGELLIPGLLVFLILTGFLLLVRCLETRSPSQFLFSGCIFGIAAITRELLPEVVDWRSES